MHAQGCIHAYHIPTVIAYTHIVQSILHCSTKDSPHNFRDFEVLACLPLSQPVSTETQAAVLKVLPSLVAMPCRHRLPGVLQNTALRQCYYSASRRVLLSSAADVALECQPSPAQGKESVGQLMTTMTCKELYLCGKSSVCRYSLCHRIAGNVHVEDVPLEVLRSGMWNPTMPARGRETGSTFQTAD